MYASVVWWKNVLAVINLIAYNSQNQWVACLADEQFVAKKVDADATEESMRRVDEQLGGSTTSIEWRIVDVDGTYWAAYLSTSTSASMVMVLL